MNTFLFQRSRLGLGLLLALACGAHADLVPAFTNTHARMVLPRRASIIFIQCHGLGYGDFSCYGQTNFVTPNFDKLAAGGLLFLHYAPGDTNIATVQSALLTGSLSGGGGVTVAQTLKKVGYRTGMIGEWPLPGKPWEQGFDEFAGFLNLDEGTNYYADSFWRRTPGTYYNATSNLWAHWRPEYGPNDGGRETIYQNSGGKKERYLPDFILSGFMANYIRINRPDKFNGFRPFFLLVNLPAPRSATPGRDDFPVPSDAPYSDEPWPQAAKNRAALITRLDGDLGRLFEQLNKLGMTNDVIIFLTSSAVPGKFADPALNFFHSPADLQGEGTNGGTAPMIVYGPGWVPAGQISSFSWSARDFLPTAAQIGFAKPPENIEGHSILPILLGKKSGNQP